MTTMSMYQASVPRFIHMLTNLHAILSKAQAHAKADAMRNQLYEKARTVDYTSGVNMDADNYVKSASVAGPGAVCTQCSTQLGGAKFCPECGAAAAKAAPKFCPQCGHQPGNSTKFCPECGCKF